MTTRLLELLHSSYSDVIKKAKHAEGRNGVRTYETTPVVTIPHDRRREVRAEYGRMCSYEMMEAVGEESVVIQQGEAFTLNRSAEGMLLLMGQAPQMKQLLEVHIPGSRWRQTVNVLEVRWTRAIHVESQGDLYLVGCQLAFGPCHYLSF